VVVDPSGARVAHAPVHVATHDGSGLLRDVTTDTQGNFSLSLPPGVYEVSVLAKGFSPSEQDAVTLASGGKVTLKIQLAVAAQAEVVDVPSDARSSTDAADNKSALVFDADRLADLSDDNSTMQQQLLALAGGDPTHPPDVYVDGFSGGHFPPKSSIREVRINQNPYSAEYPGFGMNRMEIFTKPGGDKLHGGFYSNGNDSPWNSDNPYTGAEPPYFSYYLDGQLSGPIGKKTSFFVGANQQDMHNNAVVNAIDPTSLGPLSEAISTPTISHGLSFRLDRQVTENNTLTARYAYDGSKLTNAGVGLLTLPSQAYDSTTTTQTLQVGDTQVITPKIVNETRFQYVRTRAQQDALNSSPSIIVQGSFNAGGSATGVSHDNQDHFEFQEYLSLSLGKHFVRTGGRYDLVRDANESTANYNGTYIFPTLAAYEAKTPSQFSLTAGQASAVILNGWAGLFAEDEWKACKSLTVNYGVRFESQSAIPDHADWAPRLGFAWAVGQKDKKPALLVLRSGFGLFYDRFALGNLLTAVRQNGISQQTVTVTDPTFYLPATPPTVASLETGSNATAPTPYSVSPHLHAQYAMYTGLSAEHSFGHLGSVTVSYRMDRDVHRYLSRNVNAPLPGTYVFGDPTSGIYPLGTSQAVDQFASDGIGKYQVLTVNGNLRGGKRLMLWGFYIAENGHTDTSGAGSFPSNDYNLSADYGRSSWTGQHVYTGGNLNLPWKINVNTFLGAGSGAPFNITTGTDLNGDTVYNDRPAFATDLTRPSVVKTAYGNFDTSPMPGQKVIPFNYGTAPGYFLMEMAVGKMIPLGRRPATPAVAASAGKPAVPAGKGDAPYSLRFGVEAQNVFNTVNPGPPVGVLNSPLFGKPLSLNSFFSSNSAANRVLLLTTSFDF
jgi:hypothetical protein